MPVCVFRNSRIYTGTTTNRTVGAIAVEGERIVAIGSKAQVEGAIRARSVQVDEVVDLDGACVLPGFYDAHIHTAHLARNLARVDLSECGSLEEALLRIKRFADSEPQREWIGGGRWDSNRWTVPVQPDRYALDTVCPDRPAEFPSIDGHTVWVNSAALRVAGIDRHTPDPIGGQIVHDERGEPTGILREAATTKVQRMSAATDTRDLSEVLLAAHEQLLGLGITSVLDLDGEDARAAYLTLHSQRQLHLRVQKSIPVDALDLAVEQGRKTGLGDDWLRTGPVKLFADGALGSRTCHMTEPFVGTTNNGIEVTASDEILRLVQFAASAGIAVATHAIGDQAARRVLDAYETLGERSGCGLRNRLEHAQFLRHEDLARMARLGVVASMQPTHCTTDYQLVDELLDGRTGDGPGALLAYGWRSLVNSGVPLAFGSDSPVEDPNPFEGVYAAATRMTADHQPAGSWQPEQCLGVMEAITAYTLGSAYAAGEEGVKGTLECGRLADFIAVDTDPVTATPDEIRTTRVLTTIVGGQVRWQRQE